MSVRTLDPMVHAALLALAAALVRLGWKLVMGFDLPDEIYLQIAASIITYLLSLFGYGLWVRITFTRRAVTGERQPYEYRPFLFG